MSDDFDAMYKSMHNGGSKRRRTGTMLLGLAVFLLAVGGGYLIVSRIAMGTGGSQTSGMPNQRRSLNAEATVREALAQGELDEASEYVKRHGLSMLNHLLEDTLAVTFLFNYDQPETAPIHNGRLQLPAGTPFFAIVQPAERCYLYLLRRTTTGQWQQLFPAAGSTSGGNPAAPMEMSIPYSGRLYNECGPGTETLFLFASRWRQEKLEKWIQKVQKSPGREELLLDYYADQRRAMQKYPGIVCKEYAFDHNQ